ncbi:YopX family protein [Mammaliicoccus sp. A-M2]|uniref:YopX family protein n=1 Tax=Mammaliicoccus sp. A-M2 TaxID=2898662 RepID=UPI001EFA95B0|nr:YopX family protein [Mammaliicoccus sp. A-M2]
MISKCKAWDKVNKEMLKVVSINFEEKFIRGLSEIESNLDIESSYNFDDVELLQSAGLTDYHYDEYFEGDIALDVTSEEIGVVEYIEGAFVMRFAGGDSVDLSDVKDEFEIVGNKFEDEYLLGEDTQ